MRAQVWEAISGRILVADLLENSKIAGEEQE
jgi:hypothetical protein